MTKGGATAGHKATNGGSAELDKKSDSQYLEGLEARFVRRCKFDLSLDDKTSSEALKVFRESKPLFLSTLGTIGTTAVEETERIWHACLLFAVKRLSNGTSAGDEEAEDNLVGFTLSQILKATQLSLLEFFKELPQVLAKVGPNLENTYGGDWEKRMMVKEFQADFYYLTLLFNYYKRVYQNLFLPTEGDGGPTSGVAAGTNGVAHTSVPMRFGWMLFLVLRVRVLSQFLDLVTYINGLLAVVIIMILHMPPALRKFSFENEDLFKKRAADGSVKIVASLCALYHDASEDDVSKMVDKASRMIGDLFKKSNGLRTRSRAEQLAGIDADNLDYFEGLMDERSITSNLRIVEQVYEEAYHSRGELDERMFINGDENLIGATCSGTPTSSGSKRKFEAISSSKPFASASTGACPSSPSSPKPSPAKPSSVICDSRMPPPTPVTVALSTAKWLRIYISPLPSEPTAELHTFFRSCDKDVSSDVTHRAQVLFEKIFVTDGGNKSRESRGTTLLDSSWVHQRRLEATKLYYRVLSTMCRAESQRLGSKNLTALLTNERFHRCMIACSAELVLYTHKTVTMTFPAILEPAGITAFDLSKVTEYFVRHEDTLPKELKRHLNSLEQQILESMAWEKGSSMYNTLIVAKKHLAPVINRLCLLADPMPALDSLSQHPVQLTENLQHEVEGTGEGSSRPSSPQKATTRSPSIVNAAPTVANEVEDQAGNIVSPSRDRASAFSAFISPVKIRPPPLPSAFASPQRPSSLGGGETCAETVIIVFFQKVLTLAYVRIKDLCDRLHQSNHVREQVYRTMKHILYNETSLCFNRHIDQLILCSIYGVCKVNKANLTFRTCIEHYGKQPQCKRPVFSNVFIDFLPAAGEGNMRGLETGDIIKFYNQIFVPATKQYLVQLGETVPPAAPTSSRPKDEDNNEKGGSAPGSPRLSFPCMSPKKVSASHNVYVSPLRSTKMNTLMSPRSRSLYACVGESTHAYQSPSKDLTAINNRLNNRRMGRLDFDGASLVSDSLVAGSLYPCARSLNHFSVRLTTDSVLSCLSQPSWTVASPLPPSPLKRPCAER